MEKIETEVPAVNLKKEALKNGAIWGAINLVIFLITWYITPDLMGSYWYSGILMLVGIMIAVFFCIDLRKKAGGYWSFGQAFWTIFVMFLLSIAIMYVFGILFGKYIDPTYPETMKDSILTKTESMYKSLGLGGEELEKAMNKQRETVEAQFSPTFSQAIVGFGIASIAYFVGALIFALIFKRNRPVFLSNPEE